MRRFNISLVLVCLLICSNEVNATVRRVPSAYPTIQDALDAAVSGDIVLVANGTYIGTRNKNLNFSGKSITLQSENGPMVSIIDCQSSGRALIFDDDEPLTTLVEGFTIKNGQLTSSLQNGAGVLIDGASATFRNCLFQSNTCIDKGGGIAVLNGSASVGSCTFMDNAGISGGAIYADESNLELYDCLVSNNTGSSGGGLFLSDVTGIVFNVVIEGNTATYVGGGMISTGFSLDVQVINCVFSFNYAEDNGGGMELFSAPTLLNCTVFSNSTLGAGGGIRYLGSSETTIRNCIIYGNGGMDVDWNDRAPDISYSDVLWTTGSTYPGVGNINQDPLFAVQDHYYLSCTATGQPQNSPCINAGGDLAADICVGTSEGLICLDRMTTRIDDVWDSGVVDMGYHYMSSLPTPTPPPTITPTRTPSHNPTRTPTVTPTSVFTATPTSPGDPTSTPSPQPTASCDITGVTITMPSHSFQAGDLCGCRAIVCNVTGSPIADHPLFVVLDVFGSYYFAPSFNSYDNYLQQFPVFSTGQTVVEVIPQFSWPSGTGNASGLRWYGALTNPSVSELFGEMGMWEFGWY